MPFQRILYATVLALLLVSCVLSLVYGEKGKNPTVDSFSPKAYCDGYLSAYTKDDLASFCRNLRELVAGVMYGINVTRNGIDKTEQWITKFDAAKVKVDNLVSKCNELLNRAE